MRRAPAVPSPWTFAIAGMVSLGVAMGIGRFAFTPLLPLMLDERLVSLSGASLLASANYLGYLLGALACTFQPWLWRRLGRTELTDAPHLVRGGLVATVVLTLGMALPWTGGWVAWRLAAGIASAFVFVHTSGWCLAQLGRLGMPSLGGIIYTGPGLGILLSGLATSTLVAAGARSTTGWLLFGALAAALTLAIWRVFDRGSEPTVAALPAHRPAAPPPSVREDGGEMALLAFAYGLAGLGYIVTATFLPVIARQALPGSPWIAAFWPLFGGGVIAGALIASRIRAGGDNRLRLAVCYGIQAAGVAASLVSPTLPGFLVGSVLLGLPFTAITFFALQEVRRIRPHAPTTGMGLLTALYGLGQIAGPPLAAWLVERSDSPAQGFDRALAIAGASLVVGAVVYGWMARRHPVVQRG